jgi:hypothetical protein
MTSLTLQYERLCPDCLQKLQVGGFLVFLPTTVVEVLVDVEEVVTTEADIFAFDLGFCFWVCCFDRCFVTKRMYISYTKLLDPNNQFEHLSIFRPLRR